MIVRCARRADPEKYTGLYHLPPHDLPPLGGGREGGTMRNCSCYRGKNP